MHVLEAADFLSTKHPMLDVRSPGEYAQGHVPGAVSFPLFSDEERAVVGTAYKQESREKAVKLGFEIVGPKMVSFIEQAEQLGSQRICVYCWRGGMRSESMGWLLEKYGFDVSLLRGGYKAYRGFMLQRLGAPAQLQILTGLTGSGKTEVLHEMEKLGAQVLDLEGLANHPGSSFGNHLKQKQPTTEMFQNRLFEVFRSFDLSRPVWVEDESICIGQVHLPEVFWEQMQKSPRYLLEIPKEVRQQTLVQQYEHMGALNLINATQEIRKKLGNQEADEAVALIKSKDYYNAAGILLGYYDKQYQKGINKLKETIAGNLQAGTYAPKEIAKKLINQYGY